MLVPLISLCAEQGWVSSGRNRFLPDIWEKLEESGFFPFLPEETWKKVEETPKCQLGTKIKFDVKGFLCILSHCIALQSDHWWLLSASLPENGRASD